MSLSNFFGWGSITSGASLEELPDIFPLPFQKDQFVEIDTISIFQKILTDVVERTHGLTDEQQELMWDNCVQSEANHGLISLLARGMTFKKEMFIVYDKALNVLRLASSVEMQQIRQDYAKSGKSAIGIFLSFAHYRKADLVRLYSALEYLTVASLHKSMHVSVAVQIKMSDIRQSVALIDKDIAVQQAMNIARSLGKGCDVFMDAKDKVETSTPDLTAVKESIEYLNEKRAFYLGMPPSYLCGEQTGGIGATGEADTKAVERGLKNYYLSIIKPVFEALFGEDVDISYKSQDFRQIDQAMNALKTFSLVGTELVNIENQTLIINKLLDLDEDAEGDGPEPVETLTPEQVSYNNTIPVV